MDVKTSFDVDVKTPFDVDVKTPFDVDVKPSTYSCKLPRSRTTHVDVKLEISDLNFFPFRLFFTSKGIINQYGTQM